MRQENILIIVFAALSIFLYEFSGAEPIPDTGQTKCYDALGRTITCPNRGEALYGQDANYKINPISYTKLDHSGKELPEDATFWTMVQDNVTRLIWELKTDDGTIHDKDNKFTWYDSNSDTNGGFPGTPSEGTDTEDFINEINAEKFGGKANWRMPKAVELFSIKNFGEEPIHNMFFPNSMEPFFWYWSSDTYTENKAWAWHMDFNYGRIVHHNEKSSLRQVWAVYGKHTNVIDQFITNPEGTITDISTGLMWERKTDDEGPNDKDNFYTWAEALAWVSKLNIDGYLGYTDWRLPTIKELHSIVDPNRYRPSINTDIFPNTQPTSYWSSTTDIVSPCVRIVVA